MHDDLTRSMDDRPQSPIDAPEARSSWGSFRLMARVGYGGFGEVYRAWDPNLEREVALKLLLPTGSKTDQSEGEYKAMLREARALASVRHPNIVPVYGIDRQDGRVGFWMDFVRGKTLSALLGSQGPFGYREAALIGLDVSRALSAVHRTGLLHRDIKAENVMREEGGRILLMDLGLSSLQHGQTTSSGTPNYMAPEIWRGEPATVKSDIYALGVLLFLLVTGEYPVKLGGLTTREITKAIAHRRTLMDLRSDLPESFLRTVNAAIETDPAKRFSSAGTLAVSLSECLGTTPPVESTQPSTTSTPAALEKPRRTLKFWLASAVFLLAAIAAFKTPAGQRLLHLGTPPVAAGISSTDNDRYIKAQELLKKSYKDSNVADAVKILNGILQDHPKFALARAWLGRAYFDQYRNSPDEELLRQATDATNEALALQKDLPLALATRAGIEAATAHTDLALTDAMEATKAGPRSPEAFAALGEVYDALGRKADAIDAVQHAIDLAPDNSMLPVRLGNYYLTDGKLNEAADQWQSVVKIDPENIFAYFDLGVVNMRLNRLADARQNFERVLRSGPDAASYRALGTVSLVEGKYDDAVGMDKKGIQIDPADPEAWADIGLAYSWEGGHREEATQAYRKAIELAEVQRKNAPDNAQLLAALADYYASTGDAAKSLPLIRKALVLSPTDPDVLYSAGDTYELLNDRKRAIPLIAEALAQGFRVNEFERSPELASLRNDPEFQTALVKAKQKATVDSAKKMN